MLTDLRAYRHEVTGLIHISMAAPTRQWHQVPTAQHERGTITLPEEGNWEQLTKRSK